MSMLEDESAVRRLIARFVNALDAKAWDELGECLADSIYTDYSDSKGTPPDAISRDAFVEARRASMDSVKTHHLTGNIEVYINGTSATARVSALIFRRNEDGQVVSSHCMFLLGLQVQGERWTLCSIVLRVLWSENPPK